VIEIATQRRRPPLPRVCDHAILNLAANVITMRLLEDRGDCNLSLVEYTDVHIPPYAILSHTWGADSDEVSFKDIMKGTGRNKDGYKKIEFCREQAAKDGLKYFWVDTCCINKSSSAELTEAINSMFKWYRYAAKCYVYLSDVSKNEHNQTGLSIQPWEAAFRSSRWFTRGWTLQELIAPRSVEFFSLEGNRLGDKKSLERQVHEVTGVAIRALQGETLLDFSVAERMSWTEKRETKRGEDMAYSLLGIFDVHIPLIYGEGKDNALRRLQGEIDLRLVPISISTPGGRSIKGVLALEVTGSASILRKYINIM
jgi:hypothetical protein